MRRSRGTREQTGHEFLVIHGSVAILAVVGCGKSSAGRRLSAMDGGPNPVRPSAETHVRSHEPSRIVAAELRRASVMPKFGLASRWEAGVVAVIRSFRL